VLRLCRGAILELPILTRIYLSVDTGVPPESPQCLHEDTAQEQEVGGSSIETSKIAGHANTKITEEAERYPQISVGLPEPPLIHCSKRGCKMSRAFFQDAVSAGPATVRQRCLTPLRTSIRRKIDRPRKSVADAEGVTSGGTIRKDALRRDYN